MLLIAALLLQTAGISAWAGFTGKAEAASNGPAVVSTYPGNGETGVPGNVNLKVTFDEPVAKGAASSYIHVRRVDTNEEVNTISAASAYVTMDATGYVANISMPKTLGVGISYYIRIDQGAFVNVSNNANYAGLSDATAWRFNVAGTDTAAPYATEFIPASGASDVSTAAWLKITFNEPVYAASGYITLTRSGGDTQTIDVGAATVTGSGTNAITINPGVLQASSTYTVSVPAGTFKDGAGNSYTGSGYWSFTTTAAPMTVNKIPANNSVGVNRTDALSLTVVGATSLSRGSGNITIKRIGDNSVFQQIDVNSGYVSIAGNVVSIGHSEFEPNNSYYVLIDPGIFKNDNNIGYQGIVSASDWTFSTAMAVDTTRPVVNELSPGNGSNVASESASLVMTFNESVYPGGGTITIKNSLTNAVFQSIPVTSPSVKGGGTNKITIDHSAFVANTSYYVQISEQAFRDMAGNYYNGISNATDWSFRVSSDTTPPVISTLTPANGTNSVGVQAPIFIMFNEPVRVAQPAGSVMIRKTGTQSTAIEATIAVDATDSRKVIITPQVSLASSASYYVEISNNAIVDLAGNRFAGIQNQVQWAFSTIGTDKTAPTLTNATMSGSSTIVLTYNEQLDPNVVPQPGSFYVTVNGEARAVIATAVSGTTVSLTLINGVLFGQTVTLTYAKGDKAIQDLSGNTAVNLTSRSITNTLDTTLPKPVSGTVNGNSVILNFNQTMAEPNTYATSQFTVKLNGYATYVSEVHTGGNYLYFTLGTTVTEGTAVSISYSQGSYPVVDSNGNALQAFIDFYLKNASDKTAPVVQSASVSGSKLTLTYNEGLDTTAIPGKASYSVVVNGQARTVTAVELVNNQVVLTLSASVVSTATVLVSYIPGSNSLRDLNGNTAVGFSGLQASVNGTSGGGTTSGTRQAIINGSSLTIVFGETLNTSYVPKVSQFSVKINGTSAPVASVSVSTSEVVLTLYTAITSTNSVTIGYTSDSGGLRNSSGVLMGSFSNLSVINVTPSGTGTNTGSSGGTANGNFEATPEGAIILQSAHYTVTSSTSPGGQSANMYTVIEESLNNGFKAARAIRADSPKVLLSIPATEKAGLASIPLQALENAKNVGGSPVIIIKYGEITYEIPCSGLDYNQIMKILNVGGTTGYLVIKIDQSAPNLTASLTSALNRSGVVTFVSPIHIEANVMVAGVAKELPSFSKYVTVSVNTTTTMTARQTAVVWVDPATNVLSYVPTKVAANGNTGSKVSFMRKGNGDFAVIKGNVSYSDLGTHWASNSILLLANKFIVEGRTTTKYEPNKPITRGEFAMFIARGLGLSGDKTAAGAYSDLNTSTALAAYIGAVSKAGIVTGNSDGTFKPNSFITRQEAAAMLNRAATYAGATVSLPQSVDTYLQRFKDRKQIGTWAKQDVAKSVYTGFMTGVTSTTFVPQANTTRAEAAIMIQRMLTYVGFLQS